MNPDTEESKARRGSQIQGVLVTVVGRARGSSSEETLASGRDGPQETKLKGEKEEGRPDSPKSLFRREMKLRAEKSQALTKKRPGPAGPTRSFC